MNSGYIDRDRTGSKALLLTFSDKPACFGPDVIIHVSDKTIFLNDGDELVRINHAPFWMTPPYQSLCSDNFIPGNTVFGLEIHYKLTLCDGALHVFLNKFPIVQGIFKLFSVK